MTTTAALLLLSATLIVSGVVVVWRDVQRNRRQAFLVRADATAVHPDVEVTVARSDPPLPRGAAGMVPDSGQDPAAWWAALQQARPSSAAEAVPASGPGRDSEPAARWTALQPVIAAAVDRVNGVLAGAGVAIGAAGEPSRSLMKGGYGVHRRILIGGESMAWLRVELGADGQLQAGVKAHKDDIAAINADAAAPVEGIDVARASDLISECLKPAVSLAMRAAGGGTGQQAGETAWKEIDALVATSLRAANGALAQAAARFLPLGGPVWVEDLRRHRLTVAIEVRGAQVARMLIERGGNDVEVAVGLSEAQLASLGRRQRLPLQGLTTHALSELIASCAWPAIAHFREHHPAA